MGKENKCFAFNEHLQSHWLCFPGRWCGLICVSVVSVLRERPVNNVWLWGVLFAYWEPYNFSQLKFHINFNFTTFGISAFLQ